MRIALIHSHFDDAHLARVKAQMVELGAPVIKAVWMEVHGHWAALEGCHRIRAAAALGLVPVIEEIEYCDATLESLDCGGDTDFTVEQIADASYSSIVIAFEM